MKHALSARPLRRTPDPGTNHDSLRQAYTGRRLNGIVLETPGIPKEANPRGCPGGGAFSIAKVCKDSILTKATAYAGASGAPLDASIYRITCRDTGSRYIGCTSRSPFVRWDQHRMELDRGVHTSHMLQAEWLRLGISGFIFEVVQTGLTQENMYSAEREWIEKERPVLNGSLTNEGKRNPSPTCSKGHEDWLIDSFGRRYCRACRRAWEARRKRAKKT